MNSTGHKKSKNSIAGLFFAFVLVLACAGTVISSLEGAYSEEKSPLLSGGIAKGLLDEDPVSLELLYSSSIPSVIEDMRLYAGLVARIKRGDILEAEEIEEELRKRFPGSFFGCYGKIRLARWYLEKGDLGLASTRISGVEVEPVSFREAAMYLYTRGVLELEKGRVEKGLGALVSCVEKFPGTVESDEAISRLMKLVKKREIVRTREGLKKVVSFASALKSMGRYEDAVEVLSGWLGELRGKTRGEAELVMADALRRLGRYSEAIALLTRKVKGIPRELQGERDFYAGAFSWYRGRVGDAINLLKKVTRKYSPLKISYRASYNLGRIYEERGEYEEALSHYGRGIKSPDAAVSFESAFRRGLMLFLLGRYDEAAEFFRREKGRFPDPRMRSRFEFFEALSVEKGGNGAEARNLYLEMLKRAEGGLYFFQSLRKLIGTYGWERFARLEFENFDSLATAESLLDRGRLSGTPAERSLKRAVEFQKLGLMAYSMEEMRRLGVREAEEAGLSWGSKEFVFGDIRGALRAASKGLAGKSGLIERERLLFPSSVVVSTQGERMGDPFFLHAIVRQESLFDVYAVSPAGAVGLGQIMPATARKIAVSLSLSSFSRELLFFPSVNAAFASVHLRGLLEKYRGNRILSAAAYNGGESAVRRWIRKCGRSPYLFPEMIGYEETRKYVRRVMYNYLMYLKIYGKGWKELHRKLLQSVTDER